MYIKSLTSSDKSVGIQRQHRITKIKQNNDVKQNNHSVPMHSVLCDHSTDKALKKKRVLSDNIELHEQPHVASSSASTTTTTVVQKRK